MKIGTFDEFFKPGPTQTRQQLQPQHRIKLLKYPKASLDDNEAQGVGPHKDSSGWLTFLYQVGHEPGLEVLSKSGEWLSAPPIDGTFVVNFGNAFEAATEGAIRATTHRVKAPTENDRYSIPFFMGLPLDLTVSHIRQAFPRDVKELRRQESPSAAEAAISTFLDPRWDSLGESQLRKWIRSHEDVGRKWYGNDKVDYYLQ
jgi:isopenicillin N synthase-like dioxygenase